MNLDQLRLEFKLDLIIRALQDKGLMLSELPQLEGVELDTCPLCESSIQITPDLETETPRYTCKCRSPKFIVTGISSLLTPRSSDVHADRNPDEEVPPERPPQGSGRG